MGELDNIYSAIINYVTHKAFIITSLCTIDQ